MKQVHTPAGPWGRLSTIWPSVRAITFFSSPPATPQSQHRTPAYTSHPRICCPPLCPALETPPCHWTSWHSLAVFLFFLSTLTSCHTTHSTLGQSARITNTSPNPRGCWPDSSLLLLIVDSLPGELPLYPPQSPHPALSIPDRRTSFSVLLSRVFSLEPCNSGQHLVSGAHWNLRLEPKDVSEVGYELLIGCHDILAHLPDHRLSEPPETCATSGMYVMVGVSALWNDP